MKLSFHQVFVDPNGLRMSELRPFYSNAAICPRISDYTAPNVFAISPCTGLQFCRPRRHWNRHLMEFLIFNFILLLHIWSGAQNWWKQRRCLRGSVTGMDELAIPSGHGFYPLYYGLMTCMVSETRVFSQLTLFSGHELDQAQS
jgi:hypothetical protein